LLFDKIMVSCGLTVQLLLSKGATIRAMNKDGLTPLTCPNRMEPAAVADLLTQASLQQKPREEDAAAPRP
jgi:hypothetical protein